MKTFAVALALAAGVTGFTLSPFVQDDPAYWEVENPDYWLGLIDKHTPPISFGTSKNGHFCSPMVGNAYNGVAEAADRRRLTWDTRLDAETRGKVEYENRKPIRMRINPDHSKHDSDYEIARTMAHEGLHWYFGWHPFKYRGKLYSTEKTAENLIREIITDCYEKEKKEEEDPEGGNPVEPVCEDQLVEEYYPDVEEQWQEDSCYDVNMIGGGAIHTGCTSGGRWVEVPVEKVRWVWRTVCEG